MVNLIEYSDRHLDFSVSLWQHCRFEQILNHLNLNLKFRVNLITKVNFVAIALPLEYLRNFWRTLKMDLIIAGLVLFSRVLKILFTANAPATNSQSLTLAITNTKMYLPVVTLSIYNK